MQKTLRTVALALALCCTAFAGEMHTPGAPVPPPITPQTQSSTVMTDSLIQTVLTLLVSVLP